MKLPGSISFCRRIIRAFLHCNANFLGKDITDITGTGATVVALAAMALRAMKAGVPFK